MSKENTMSLSKVSKGQKVTIVSINLSENGVNRLSALGLVPGTRIRVIDNSLVGTSCIECRGAKLALGRGLPDYVEVN